MKTLIVIIQSLLIIAISPLISGIIRKIKNNLRMRKGPGIFQPYYNLFKLFYKEELISKNVSWIFHAAPFIVLSSTVAVLLLVPVIVPEWSLNFMGDFLLIIFLLGLGRFFLALSGLDTGSAFGGMGSSREMFISSFVEPIMLIAVFAVAVKSGYTNMSSISAIKMVYLSSVVAAVALLFVTIAETSRLPVDNQETHLELTMIHEAMVLEYSGRSLAIIELASHIKQIVFFTIMANILFPLGMLPDISPVMSIVIYLLKIIGICVIISVIEISIAKLRLFRVIDFLSFGFVLSFISMIVAVMGY